MYPKFTVSQPKFEADISEGNFFRSNVFSETVADDGIMNFFIRTKAPGVQLSFEAQGGGLADIHVTEGASLETAGVNATLFNLNRANEKTSTMSVTHGSSFSNGTVIYEDIMGEAVGGNQAGGGESNPDLIVLAGSEHYVVSVQNLSGGATNIDLAINFTDVT